MLRFLMAVGLGAALEYFLDPDRGRRRRAMAQDRTAALARRCARQASQLARYAASTAVGWKERAEYAGIKPAPPANDEMLTQRVESEVFRDPSVPKGQLNINSEHGLVVLRGQVDSEGMIREIEDKVRKVPGVKGVENLLHLPGTPAPGAFGHPEPVVH